MRKWRITASLIFGSFQHPMGSIWAPLGDKLDAVGRVLCSELSVAGSKHSAQECSAHGHVRLTLSA